MSTYIDLLNALNTLDLLLVLMAIGFATVLMAIFLIGRRIKRVREEMIELRQRSSSWETDAHLVPVPSPAAPISSEPSEPPPLTLQLQQIKRQQGLVLDRLREAQGTSEVVAELSGQLARVERDQAQLLDAFEDVSGEVQEWTQRLTAIRAEVGALLESDAIADFVRDVGAREA
jgi:hypothetical protein